MNIPEQRAHVRDFLKHAAKAQDAGTPLKSLTYRNDGKADEIDALLVFGLITVEDTSDDITVTIEGRMFAGMIVGEVPDFGPGKLAEMRGSITETELAARYIEGKVGGVEKAIREHPEDRDNLEWIGRILTETAREFRQQLHVPSLMVEGRVIPYNENNETGVQHAANLLLFFSDVGERNVRAGWWSDLETGESKKRNVGELLMLMVTEIVEAYDAWRDQTPDDKLPEHPGFGVEIGDLLIRAADLCGAAMRGVIVAPSINPPYNPGDKLFQEIREIAHRYEAIRKTPEAVGEPETSDFLPPMDIAAMVDAKLHFNANRPDHKIEARLADDGKKT